MFAQSQGVGFLQGFHCRRTPGEGRDRSFAFWTNVRREATSETIRSDDRVSSLTPKNRNLQI
jgi:hypothetical protein